MRLAHMRGDRGAFDLLREEMSKEQMPGRLRTYYHLTAGQGLQRFGRIRESRAAYQQAVELAQTFRVNKLLMQAERLLKLTEPEPQKPRQRPQESAALAPIFTAIDERRGPFAGTAS